MSKPETADSPGRLRAVEIGQIEHNAVAWDIAEMLARFPSEEAAAIVDLARARIVLKGLVGFSPNSDHREQDGV